MSAELTEQQIWDWWASENGFEDHNLCKLPHFREIVRAVEAKLASLPSERPEAEDGWQPIDTAPKDGGRFLAFYDGAIGFFHWQDFRDGGDSPIGWRDSFINVYPVGSGPTHWMPLPKPPALAASQGAKE